MSQSFLKQQQKVSRRFSRGSMSRMSRSNQRDVMLEERGSYKLHSVEKCYESEEKGQNTNRVPLYNKTTLIKDYKWVSN